MQEPPVVRPSQSPPVRPRRSVWRLILESRPVMLLMLFGVTGGLGIPLLWRSPRFSQREKVVWSIIVGIYTLLLIGGTAGICWWSYSQLRQLLS